MPAEELAGEQEGTALSTVLTVRQVIVVKPLLELPLLALQVETGTSVKLLLPQVVAVQELADDAGCSEHEATPVGPLLFAEQLVDV